MEPSKQQPELTHSRATSSVFQAACKYRDLGLSVIPLRGKRPLVAWAEYAKRLPTVNELKSWFHIGERLNVGLVTGKISGLIVVDLDDDEAIKYWSECGAKTDLIAMTGGGGMHLFYRSPNVLVRNRVKALGKAIDVRAENAVAAIEPSISETGLPYRFATPIEDVDLGSLPVFDSSWVTNPVRHSRSVASRPAGRQSRIRDIHAYVRSIPAVSGQAGHNAAFRVANLLVHEAGMSEEQAFDAMTAWSLECAEPPFSPSEIAHKIKDAIRVGRPPR